MAKTIEQLEQAVDILEQSLLEAKAAHETAQVAFSAEVRLAAAERNRQTEPHNAAYLTAEAAALAKTDSPATAYAAKRTGHREAVRQLNDAVKAISREPEGK